MKILIMALGHAAYAGMAYNLINSLQSTDNRVEIKLVTKEEYWQKYHHHINNIEIEYVNEEELTYLEGARDWGWAKIHLFYLHRDIDFFYIDVDSFASRSFSIAELNRHFSKNDVGVWCQNEKFARDTNGPSHWGSWQISQIEKNWHTHNVQSSVVWNRGDEKSQRFWVQARDMHIHLKKAAFKHNHHNWYGSIADEHTICAATSIDGIDFGQNDKILTIVGHPRQCNIETATRNQIITFPSCNSILHQQVREFYNAQTKYYAIKMNRPILYTWVDKKKIPHMNSVQMSKKQRKRHANQLKF